MTKCFFKLIVAFYFFVITTSASGIAFGAERTVMVHLFEWKWKDVAKECKSFLGPAGFAAVQVSPPNEHAVVPGHPWYQRYQPVSYKLESRSGSREEFVHMVKTCKEAGVDIYVDAVINHMTGVVQKGEVKVGFAGTPFGHYDYPGIYSFDDFHHCDRNGNDNIHNYGDRWEVQNCELSDLTDLNTSNEKVQTKISAYLAELISIGVAGFRIDAAKHMASQDIQKVLEKISPAYIYQEVIDQGSEPIKAQEYFQNGDVTEFKYSLDVSRTFKEGQLSWFNGAHQLGVDWGYMPSDKAVVFVDNHDNQRGHGGGGHILTHKDGKMYELANIFMLAWPYGYPQIISSFAFSDNSQGPPSNSNGETKEIECLNQSQATTATDGWVCEHRWNSVAAMVGFRNATRANTEITDWWTNGRNQIAFGRGNLGFVVINNEDTELDQEYVTQLGAGKYCDAISDNFAVTECSGTTVVIGSDGRAKIKTAPRSATVLYQRIQ